MTLVQAVNLALNLTELAVGLVAGKALRDKAIAQRKRAKAKARRRELRSHWCIGD
jgi:hypothetical protein